MGRQKQVAGQFGELLARDVLLVAGHRILTTNYRSRWGEVDLITQQDTSLHFVEVKYRKSRSFGIVEESITSTKLHRSFRTAESYLTEHNFDGTISFLAVCIDDTADQIDVRIYQQEI